MAVWEPAIVHPVNAAGQVLAEVNSGGASWVKFLSASFRKNDGGADYGYLGVGTDVIDRLGPELLTNGDFSAGGPPPTLGSNWSIGSGVATRTSSGVGTHVQWSVSLVVGAQYLAVFDLVSISGGATRPRFFTDTIVDGTDRNTPGRYAEVMVPVIGNNLFGISGLPNFAGSIDNVSLRKVIT